MIKEICAYIAANTAFVVGTDLIEISADSNVQDECVIVDEPAPGTSNGLLPDLRQVPLVAYARAETRFTARDNAYVVFDLLTGIQQITLPVVDAGETYVCNFECRTPYFVGLDETGKRYIYALPIDVTVTNIL